jgi:hypothetical protein
MKKNHKEDIGESVEKRIFSDPSLPAGFEALKESFIIIPHKNPTTGDVEFQVEGEGIDEALEKIYKNSPVGVLDFIKALKSFRSSIFALKGGRR